MGLPLDGGTVSIVWEPIAGGARIHAVETSSGGKMIRQKAGFMIAWPAAMDFSVLLKTPLFGDVQARISIYRNGDEWQMEHDLVKRLFVSESNVGRFIDGKFTVTPITLPQLPPEFEFIY